jgi:hypothetical protein
LIEEMQIADFRLQIEGPVARRAIQSAICIFLIALSQANSASAEERTFKMAPPARRRRARVERLSGEAGCREPGRQVPGQTQ